MELFTFVRMGGSRDRIVLKSLGSSDVDFGHFEAGKAQCFLPRDRDRMLGVIEATFGELRPFNQVVRGLLTDDTSDKANEDRRKPTSQKV